MDWGLWVKKSILFYHKIVLTSKTISWSVRLLSLRGSMELPDVVLNASALKFSSMWWPLKSGVLSASSLVFPSLSAICERHKTCYPMGLGIVQFKCCWTRRHRFVVGQPSGWHEKPLSRLSPVGSWMVTWRQVLYRFIIQNLQRHWLPKKNWLTLVRG